MLITYQLEFEHFYLARVLAGGVEQFLWCYNFEVNKTEVRTHPGGAVTRSLIKYPDLKVLVFHKGHKHTY